MSIDESTFEQSTNDALSFLRTLREPEQLLLSIDEEIALGPAYLESRVTMQINAGHILAEDDSSRTSIIIDLVHPDRGVPIWIEDLSSNARLLSHDEHVAIARSAIVARFGTVVTSMDAGKLMPSAFYEELARQFQEICEIPEVGQREARRRFERCFDDQALRLRLFSEVWGIFKGSYDESAMTGLFMLCKRLSEKYFILAEIPVESTSKIINISYTLSRETTSDAVSRSEVDQKRPAWRSLLFATAENSIRIHLPLAKRTSHYRLHLISPRGHFFSTRTLVERTFGGRITSAQPGKRPRYGWSVYAPAGREAIFFIDGARAEKRPIYATVKYVELPGRSTSTMAALAFAVSALIIAIGISRGGIGEDAVGLVSAILALLSAGTIVGSTLLSASKTPAPILSRMTPTCLAFCVISLLFWLVSYDSASERLQQPEWIVFAQLHESAFWIPGLFSTAVGVWLLIRLIWHMFALRKALSNPVHRNRKLR